ncbi:hypothetical protein AGMMS49975_02540 [Clostridia bacterium]|nr:hypothetical protein AGMMS49975_02540 [Clostridia bacterium]
MNELLGKKQRILTEILNLTKDVTFVGDESDAERFVELMIKRGELFDEIFPLDAELAKNSVPAVNDEINKLLCAIKKIDEENDPFVKKAHANLKIHIKEVKTTRNLNEKYQQYSKIGESVQFDTKN